MNNICCLTFKDINEAAHIHKESLEEHWTLPIFQEILEDPACGSYCIKNAKGLRAFLIYRRLPDNVLEILTFVVRKIDRNKGLGRFLLTSFIKQHMCERIEKIILEVRENNQVAKHLYESLGFEIEGRRKNLYTIQNGTKQDALLLKLNLKNNKIILAL